MKSQFDITQAAEIDANLKEYSMLFASCAEDRFGSGFHEIGIDFGIDAQGQIALFEANMNNVGMNFHEYETARFGIAYALYLTRAAGTTEQGLHKGRE
ncbi:hypothetical protein D3C71_1782610 [compost metagenome]